MTTLATLTGTYHVYEWTQYRTKPCYRIGRFKHPMHRILRESYLGIKDADWLRLMAARGVTISVME